VVSYSTSSFGSLALLPQNPSGMGDGPKMDRVVRAFLFYLLISSHFSGSHAGVIASSPGGKYGSVHI